MIATSPPAHPHIPWYQRIELPTLLPSALLALVMLWSVVQSVAAANWAEGLGVLVFVALPALLSGLIFARLAWLPGWLAHSLSAVLGLTWAIQCVGPLLQREVQNDLGPALAERLTSWSDRASEIMIRSITLARIVQAGGRGEDIVLFIVALALLMWALGYTTGWLLFRANWSWAAVVLNALVILVNYTFTLPKPTTLFFVFLGAALLLIVHQNITQQQRRWSAALLDFPDWMPQRFLAAAALAIGATALITSLLPGNVSSAQAARTWRVVSAPFTAVREGWETAFSTIQAPPGTSGSGFFTRSMRVGGGRALGDGIVLRVRSSTYDYWRAITRDRYNGRAWENTVGENARAATGASTAEGARTPLDVGMNAAIPLQGRTLVTQTVELAQERADNLLVMGGQFASAGVPVLIEHGFTDGTPPVANYNETSGVFTQETLQSTSVYTVASYISQADIASLRSAPATYDGWLQSRYLQIPTSLPQRVKARAEEIVTAAGATNPYDKAVAIQNALRTFTYDETRAAPPTDRDWADYFLFDSKKGYCDDFATAMILMLRAQGVPARLAQGYAGGTLDPQSGAYVVRESVAHSWPEVYFPGYGWQRFEPTPASYTNIPLRPSTSDGTSSAAGGSYNIPDAARNRDLDELERQMHQSASNGVSQEAIAAAQRAEFQRNLLIAVSIVLAIAAFFVLAYYQLNRNLRGLSPAAMAYARMARLATWAGVHHEESLTPREYGITLANALPEQRDHVDAIVNGYVRERYHSPAAASTTDYNAEWQALRRPLLARLFGQPFARKRK